ncbi:GCD complex subunit gcd7 [Paramarasmius palmivorus]|uniref:Translation initiation factor eIF2B subunit beta n=1 Tax=Paramarasmius palmivorus TaxID=297713 RepID=A0AAW0DT79_9AGAR
MASDPQLAANQRFVEDLASRLRRRQVVGSRATALETLLVLRQVVSRARFSNIDQLVDIIRSVGRRLVEAQPKEHSVGNTVRKVLHHIREEYHTATQGEVASSSSTGKFSIAKFVRQGQPRKQVTVVKSETKPAFKENDPDDPDSFARGLKPVLMEAIQDVFDELETVYDNISKNAKDHVHSDEIILTLGASKTVESFLKAAAHHRNYTVIVAETAPSLLNIRIDVSSEQSNTGGTCDLANGGMFATSGSLLAVTAARAYSTPVVVCAGQFKLTPLWNLYHEYGALDFGDPNAVLGFEEGDLVEKADVVNPYYDYVRPELVSAYITNYGDHPPSSIYRLIKESYDDEDIDL